MMVMTKDEWVRVAMTDDGVVAEFLLRLKQVQAKRPSAVIPLRWGLRLPRSRPATASATGGGGGGGGGGGSSMRCDAVSFRKGSDSSTRCSPTTPLSWSGGGGAASPSGTADEETSHHDGNRSPSGVRSKGTATAETASTSTKRSRKKKTFSELKEEEGHLIKEKLHLKKEIATLHASCKEHRARNQNLKRIKRDLNVQSTKNLGLASSGPGKATFSQTHHGGVSSSNGVPSTPPIHAKCDNHPQSDSCETDNASSSHDRFFLLPDLNVLPDLNMMPSEEDTCMGNLYEMR